MVRRPRTIDLQKLGFHYLKTSSRTPPSKQQTRPCSCSSPSTVDQMTLTSVLTHMRWRPWFGKSRHRCQSVVIQRPVHFSASVMDASDDWVGHCSSRRRGNGRRTAESEHLTSRHPLEVAVDADHVDTKDLERGIVVGNRFFLVKRAFINAVEDRLRCLFLRRCTENLESNLLPPLHRCGALWNIRR